MDLNNQMLRYSYAARLVQSASGVRRKIAGQSPRAFAEVYLGAHCHLPFSRMHGEIFDLLAEITDKRNARVAIAAPRGHAKSTIITLAYVLWSALYEKEKHILIVSATQPQAVQLLRDVKKEVVDNPAIVADFEDVLSPRRSPNRQTKTLIGDVMVSAYGARQGLRGAKHRQHRPGLIIADDLEDKETVIYEDQRDKLQGWFTGTLLKAGDPGVNVVVVGTVLHHDSLLANLTDPTQSPGWRSYKYQAVERPPDRPELWEKWSAIYRHLGEFKRETGPKAAEAFYEANCKKMLKGAAVLWPELEDYHALMIIRQREGTASFQAEKQNEPLDPEVCIFSESTFHYWDDDEFDNAQAIVAVARDGEDWGIYGACDPSLGRRAGRGDFTAIVILAVNFETKIRYVIGADIMHLSPSKTVQRIITYAQAYRFERFAVEGNQFQSLLYEDLKKRAKEANARLPSYRIENRTNKQSRIASIEPLVSQGLVRFSRQHQKLLEQLRQFPVAAHDDGPDALEMALQAGRRLDHGPQMISSTSGLRNLTVPLT